MNLLPDKTLQPTALPPLSLGLRQLTVRKASGYFLLGLSCLTWGAIAALPFFKISVGEAAALTTGLIIAGEASFVAGIALLGKETWEKIKAVFRKK